MTVACLVVIALLGVGAVGISVKAFREREMSIVEGCALFPLAVVICVLLVRLNTRYDVVEQQCVFAALALFWLLYARNVASRKKFKDELERRAQRRNHR